MRTNKPIIDPLEAITNGDQRLKDAVRFIKAYKRNGWKGAARWRPSKRAR